MSDFTKEVIDLHRQLLEDSTEAFDRLVDLFYDEIYRSVSRMTQNPTQAEDLTQEIFLKLWTLRKQLKGEYLQKWLHRVAINICLNLRRDEDRRGELVVERFELLFPKTPPILGSDEFILKMEQRELLLMGLRLLPEHYQDVIVLYYLAELSFPKIGDRLNLSPDNARMRLRRAETHLRRWVKSRGGHS